MNIFVSIAMIVCLALAGCSGKGELASYQGTWEIDKAYAISTMRESLARSGMSEEQAQRLIEEMDPSGSVWIIKDGVIRSSSSKSGDSEVISIFVVEDNMNSAEVLVNLPGVGHCVLRLEIRDEYLNVYMNPYRRLLQRYQLIDK